MPRVATLTDTKIKYAKPQEKEYNLSAGQGLQLRVKPNGSKLWLFNYTKPYTGKRTNLGIGLYPSVSLKAAISERDKYLVFLATGNDPKALREEAEDHARASMSLTFAVVYDRWLEVKRATISDAYLKRMVNSISLHILPELAGVPISRISAPAVIKVLKPVADNGHLESVRKLCRWLNEIMDYAVNTGLIAGNCLFGIRKAFPAPSSKNHPTLKAEELPVFFDCLERSKMSFETKSLIHWMLHTLVRPGEAASAEWSEIDIEGATWTIPNEKMKMKRDHIVPLTRQAIEILQTLKPLSGHRRYVFPGRNNVSGHINSETANVAFKRMGYKSKFVSHGIRALGSTILHEHRHKSELIELSLAHVDRNQIRAAYNRAEHLPERRDMMQWWSDYLDLVMQQGIPRSA
ncbi:tyrosine-type recombinase/integrase [Pseudohongiella sp.]|uniref:Tyr recombinase domain-containing protein n=1 Tax=marine sediment metagenome TaxID=412755 RepID=A0A0F9YIN6_9ZZZZ|nr:integrase arm-type DNA-binding domain-containing protein [Pseudohongiella sp.]HDZ09317.1 DUF4102 domain-containing protein [Pseudohongiella sp.]HEA63834.1 DUF4102 domain-containing protein [Pseudohongiella sp.]